jgi:integrative and conjugative element protein (TIGR02256 family)
MTNSWITLFPRWYVAEREAIARHYPHFRVLEPALKDGNLVFFGDLEVRPPGGTVRHPVVLEYPEATPFEKPIVTPVVTLPEPDEMGRIRDKPPIKFFDHRHQMPSGQLCLFQRESRLAGGDVVNGVQSLTRAELWFLGHHTGHWPPDSEDCELEQHFTCVTNVLLGETFFRDDIDGHGRFYMVPDLRRAVDSETNQIKDVYPFIVTMLTREDSLIRVFDARSDVSNIFPWIRADHWDPEKVAALENQSQNRQAASRGYWWSLTTEPTPFRDGAGFLAALSPAAKDGDAWSLVSAALKAELTTDTRHFLALRYPARHGGPSWLMLMIVRPDRKGPLLVQSEHEKRREFEKCPIFCLRVHSARAQDLRLRNTGVVDGGVTKKTVALVGLGALGSEVAELLAKAGIGAFRLCDADRLSTGNVLRHVGGLNEFGASKTRVVVSRLFEINPHLKFDDGSLIHGSAVASLERLSEFIAPADLVISTTADESVESVINQIAVLDKKPVLYGRALRRGSMGRVFLVRPGRDACKACLAELARASAEGDSPDTGWIDVSEPEDIPLLHECGRPVIPASAIDLSFVAALIARNALDYLEGKDRDENHWLWSKTPATDVDVRLAAPFVTFQSALKPRFGCQACQEPDVVSVSLSESARADIVAITNGSPEAETGGVLIGYVDDIRRAVVLRATGPGPDAERSATIFSRDVPFIQAEIEQAAAELGERGLYIGEWHSHLEAEPRPSPTDIRSLFGIASAPNYLTRCPVMIIAGYDPAAEKVAGLFAWSFPVAGRMYSIRLEDLEVRGESR